ncbi:TSUP family transporter [Paenirhodobacter populi]|uniref:Probable membrane transporter protein n=1 Tax=Paenirhodobacter populi TaxID=2306993 RepID=A0A443IND3_9RHOB|nr:TSUP family transporter [Sinirhodobacter populi]RWR06820.1 hypothetical protein D2T33_18155 [Sinirhodobacter populi]
MFEVSTDLVLFLLGAALLAGFVDSIAGGGGLITLPALLLAGASPLGALSTNKVQSIFGSATSAYSYAVSGHVDPRSQIRAAAVALLAGIAGAWSASLVPMESLRIALPVILIAIAAFFAFRRGLNDLDRVRRISPLAFTAFVVPVVGFYDGAVGPGAGSFYMLGFVTLAGYGVLKATAHTKMLNFASNFGGFLAYALTGHAWWAIGLAMGVAQIIGARIGSRMAMKQGARLIRPLLVVTSTLMALRLVWQML